MATAQFACKDQPGEGLSGPSDSPSTKVLLAVKMQSLWMKIGSEWEVQPDLPDHPLWEICFCSVTDGIIAAGGIVGANVNSLCHHFSVHTRSWRRLPDMSTARMAAAAVLVGDVMQVFGGLRSDGLTLDVCESFHMRDSVWSSAASMLKPLYKPLVAAVLGKVYVLPRESPISPGTQIQKYDPAMDCFSWAAHIPEYVQDTSCACIAAAEDRLYLFGGLALQYSPSVDQWTQLQSPPGIMYEFWGCIAFVHSGKLLLCGGNTEKSTGGDDHNMVAEYDWDTHKWQRKDFKLPTAFFYNHSHVCSIRV